jgi:hypothetical protein
LSSFIIKNRAILSFGLLSLLLYLIDYLYLGNSKEVVAGFLGNMAFLPVYVIFVMLIVEQKIRERELQAIKNKLNMVIGVFYSEVGNGLLKELSAYIVMCEKLKEQLKVTDRWKEADYNAALKFLNENDTQIECEKCDLEQLKRMLISKIFWNTIRSLKCCGQFSTCSRN